MNVYPAWVKADAEWRSALHVLRAPALQWKPVMSYVDFERRIIRWDELLEAAALWSHGEQLLLLAALCLFNGGFDEHRFDLADALGALDAPSLARLLEGIMLRRPGLGNRVWAWIEEGSPV